MTTPAVLPNTPTREQIERFEEALLAIEAAGGAVIDGEAHVPVAIDTWHHFADGLVARTILIPAGTKLTGAAHKHEHLNVCCGDIEVWTEGGMKRLTGYPVRPSLPGAKRAGRTFADTFWTTVHLNPANERDVALLEDALVEDADRLQSRRLALVANNTPEALG